MSGRGHQGPTKLCNCLAGEFLLRPCGSAKVGAVLTKIMVPPISNEFLAEDPMNERLKVIVDAFKSSKT